MVANRPKHWDGVPVPYGLPIERFEERLTKANSTAWAAIVALAHDTRPESLEILSWKADELPRCRTWACELAARYGVLPVRSDVEVLAKDGNGHVRKAALRALQQG